MYLPKSFEVTDSDKLAEVMLHFSFATLITTTDGVPFATHLPVLHRSQSGTSGVLVGHVARENPQWQHFANLTESLAIFSGPHVYISPSWYATELAVPTWTMASRALSRTRRGWSHCSTRWSCRLYTTLTIPTAMGRLTA